MRPGEAKIAMTACFLWVTGTEPQFDEARGPATTASSVPLQWDWQAPDGCPDTDEVRALVSEMLDRELVFDADAEARVQGTVFAEADGYRVELETEVLDKNERRTLVGSTCDDVAEASVLVVTLALEPFAALYPAIAATPAVPGLPSTEPSLPLPEEPVRAVPIEGPRVEDAASSVRRFDSSRQRGAIFVAGGGAFGWTGSASPTIGGGLAWLPPSGRLEINARYAFRTTYSPGFGFEGQVWGTSVELRGCWTQRRRTIELLLCGGADVGFVGAEARGVGLQSRPQRTPYFGLIAGFGGAWEFASTWALRVDAELEGVPLRPAFHVSTPDQPQRFFLVPPVFARIALAVEARFPRRK